MALVLRLILALQPRGKGAGAPAVTNGLLTSGGAGFILTSGADGILLQAGA